MNILDDMLFGLGDPYDEELLGEELECQYCGVGELHWEKVDDKWRLFDADGEQHICDFGFRIVDKGGTLQR